MNSLAHATFPATIGDKIGYALTTELLSGLPAEERCETGWYTVDLPAGVTPEDAKELWSAALGVAINWTFTENVRGGKHAKQWSVYGLTPEQIARGREALIPWQQTSEDEQAAQREQWQIARDAAKAWAEFRAQLDDAI